MFRYAIAAAFAALFALPLKAHDFTAGDLTIAHPYARETTSQAQMTGGFMTITNSGEQDDVLTAVEVDFARTEVHLTADVDGVMQMREIEGGLVIPAGESVVLERGSFHVMFMGLEAPLVEGERRDAVLIFERAGRVPVRFTVEPFNYRPEGASVLDEMDHAGHGDQSGHDR